MPEQMPPPGGVQLLRNVKEGKLPEITEMLNAGAADVTRLAAAVRGARGAPLRERSLRRSARTRRAAAPSPAVTVPVSLLPLEARARVAAPLARLGGEAAPAPDA